MTSLFRLKLKDLLRMKARLDPIEVKGLHALAGKPDWNQYDRDWVNAMNDLYVLCRKHPDTPRARQARADATRKAQEQIEESRAKQPLKGNP